MKQIPSREKQYDEPFQPIDHDVIARRDDPSDAMVSVQSYISSPVSVEKYYKEIIEKRIEIKYRRFSFRESGII